MNHFPKLTILLRAAIVAALVLYLFSATFPYMVTSELWFLSLLGLVFPYLLTVTTIVSAVLMYMRSWWSVVSMAVLLSGYPTFMATFGLNFRETAPTAVENASKVRVLSWNVSKWDQVFRPFGKPQGNRDHMLTTIMSSGADVICLHEFFEPVGKGLKYYDSNIRALQDSGFRYYRFFPTSAIHDRTKLFGMAIFSKFPIGGSYGIDFHTKHSEGLMYADLDIRGKTIRMFSTHIESFKSGKKKAVDSTGRSNLLKTAKSSAWSFRTIYELREGQKALITDAIAENPYPGIVCGNLGDVPASNTYFSIRGDYRDAFLEKGMGLGKTFRSRIPNLRVDYIFADPVLKVLDFKILNVGYSDHYPLVMDFVMKP